MAGRILVIGSSCVDVILQLDHLPVTEEDMHPKSQSFRMGGCAYNAANILGKAGADVTFVTPVGMKGLFGPFVLRAVQEQPWVHPVCLEDEENGCCYCLVEKDGERTFLSVHGVEYTFSPEWMRDVMQTPFDFIYVSGLEVEERTGDALTDFLEGLKSGTVFYAPGPRILSIPEARQERILKLHPVLHLNRQEACRFTGLDDPEAAALSLHEKTENAVIVTLGKGGALAMDRRGRKAFAPGAEIDRVVDTIGAGDAHAGMMLFALAQGMDMERALMLANRVSALVVGVEGASLKRETLMRVL